MRRIEGRRAGIVVLENPKREGETPNKGFNEESTGKEGPCGAARVDGWKREGGPILEIIALRVDIVGLKVGSRSHGVGNQFNFAGPVRCHGSRVGRECVMLS